jgi:osmotically-inducible protein OsmY
MKGAKGFDENNWPNFADKNFTREIDKRYSIERKHDRTSQAVDPANTGVNVRDRDNSAKTPFDQKENQKDINITANIRKRVVDTKMSVNAQNVKIITQDGKVTLRGPVKSADEKTQIEKLAQEVAGTRNVDNQLEIQR